MSDLILGPLGEALIQLVQELSNPIFDLYFGVVTALGDTLPVLIVLVLLYYTYNKDFLSKMVYVQIFSAHLNYVAKIFFHNSRPYLFDSEYQVTTDVLGKQTLWGGWRSFFFIGSFTNSRCCLGVPIFKDQKQIPNRFGINPSDIDTIE